MCCAATRDILLTAVFSIVGGERSLTSLGGWVALLFSLLSLETVYFILKWLPNPFCIHISIYIYWRIRFETRAVGSRLCVLQSNGATGFVFRSIPYTGFHFSILRCFIQWSSFISGPYVNTNLPAKQTSAGRRWALLNLNVIFWY